MSIEFQDITSGDAKIYTHEIFFCIDKNGKVLKLRMSYDEENLFVRSAHILKPDVDFEGRPIFRNVSIKNIHTSDRMNEAVDSIPDNLNFEEHK